MNTVKWPQSYDPTTASYKLQSSADAAIWTDLATVAHAIPGPNWDAVNDLFFYDDPAGAGGTWYRIAIIDTFAQQGAWSEPMQVYSAYVPPWPTAGEVVNDCAVEVGLDEVADPFNDLDSNIKQLCRLLNRIGRDTAKTHRWNHLRGEATFTTVAGVSAYPMPPDFYSMVDQTMWNRTNRLPVGGPMSPQEWQYLRARLVNVVFNVIFRPMDRQIHLYPEINTPGGFQIAYEYRSSYWVSETGSPDTATSDSIGHSSDLVWFDKDLLITALKVAFLQAKGFDTSAAMQDAKRAFDNAISADTPAPTLNGTRLYNYSLDPLIGGQSIPVTGFGS